MRLSRRTLLSAAGIGAGAGFLGVGSALIARGQQGTDSAEAGRAAADPDDDDEPWASFRGLFELDPELIHLAGMMLAPHPRPVREAIEEHRRAMDREPAGYVERHHRAQELRVRRAVAAYLGASPEQVATTFNTTTGLGLVYGGVSVREGQELLTTEHDYHATHAALRFKAARVGAEVRTVSMYDDPAEARADEMVERVIAGVTDRTRVVALTWVHSSSGVKIPVRAIADELARINRGRDDDDRVLLCVDGVHGVGVEADGPDDLGCDALIAGAHKWLFGPRGTGFVWARPEAHGDLDPIIETFTRGTGWGGTMTPGGFHAFEHRWALPEALALHEDLGKRRIQERIHALAAAYKEALAGIRGVTLRTPRDAAVSAGIVCFEVAGRSPRAVVRRLRDAGVVASTTPYTPSYARLAPGLLNHPGEVDPVVRAIRAM